MQGNYGIGEHISKYVKRLTLTLEDGSQKEIQPETDKDGNGLIDLSVSMELLSLRMEMKDDFVLKSGQGIRPNTYTSFKDPEKTSMKMMRPRMNSRIQVSLYQTQSTL